MKDEFEYPSKGIYLLILTWVAIVCFAAQCAHAEELHPAAQMFSEHVPLEDGQQWFSRYEVKKLIMACGAYNIDMCGDVICEGDTDVESVIWSTTSAMLLCLKEPTMSEEYMPRKRQREVLRAYDLGWWIFE